jgi:hypothetical protein
MSPTTYAEAVDGALDRLQTTGFYQGNTFANHGPMAAEALARLGYCDEVDGWVDDNIHHREYGPLPKPWQPIKAESRADWQSALGDRQRGGDWVELFRRHLAETAWRAVLESWWPRLLPGCAGSLTHGLIRTAHAVRSLAVVDRPSELQIDELARGLAFWATGYSPLPDEIGQPTQVEVASVDQALSELTAEYAGHYAATMPSFPVPLIHTVTAPAAMRLVLAELPAELHGISLHTIQAVNRSIFDAFGGRQSTTTRAETRPGTEMGFAELAAEAIDIGDEHAIKMCEAAIREHAIHPDPRYFSAANTALGLIRKRSAPGP